ncbi:hypothetical protein [Actinomadura bangladeshensis]|uniref:Uncharacterized protein n=1 Tax=Actinomadura bangladeshensis TaxID=453573 RepID=A0A6L9QL32_9ACTN|nr:hypothetical protein [Actinomadura bangladeshensis]NEA26220.1 hypothetical protein [Actinomadura bangladeshensis]
MSEPPGQSSITSRTAWPKPTSPAAAADTRRTERDNLNELMAVAEALQVGRHVTRLPPRLAAPSSSTAGA